MVDTIETFWDSMSELDFLKVISRAMNVREAFLLMEIEHLAGHEMHFAQRMCELKAHLPPNETVKRYTSSNAPEPFCALLEQAWEDVSERDFLLALVGTSKLNEVYWRLNIIYDEANKTLFLKKAQEFDINVYRFHGMPISALSRRSVQEAVSNSTTFSGVGKYLGVPRGEKKMAELKELISLMDINTTHFLLRWSSVTKKQMEEALKHENSPNRVATHLGCTLSTTFGGSNAHKFYARVQALGLVVPLLPSEQKLVSIKTRGRQRVWLLLNRGEKCEECDIKTHQGKIAPLDVHHEDECRTNNTEKNLTLLCGNCHSHRHERKNFIPNRGQCVETFDTVTSIRRKRHYLIRERGEECEECFCTGWNYSYIPLEMHHINQNREDNTRENLLLLCHNCHIQEHDVYLSLAQSIEKHNAKTKKKLDN